MKLEINKAFFKNFSDKVEKFKKSYNDTAAKRCVIAIRNEIEKSKLEKSSDYDVKSSVKKDGFSIQVSIKEPEIIDSDKSKLFTQTGKPIDLNIINATKADLVKKEKKEPVRLMSMQKNIEARIQKEIVNEFEKYVK